MSSNIILADNGVSSGTAGIKESGGSDGTLLLQTTTSGGTATTAITINNSQVVTVAGTINSPAATNLVLQSAGTTAVTIDTAQNVGVGVTPASWYTGAGYKVLQINSSSIFADTSEYRLQFMANMYTNSSGTLTYTSSGYANFMQMRQGGFNFFTNSTSGTAGTAVTTYTQAMTLDNSGNLLVGTTNTSFTTSAGLKILQNSGTPQMGFVGADSTNASSCYILYSTNAGAYRFYVGYDGTVHATNLTISAISDQRLKENVRDIDTGLTTINALKPRRFDWISGKGQDKKNVAGFIAQEFEEIFPECVANSKAGEDGIEYKSINYETLIPTLVKAIQELSAKVTALEAKVGA